MKGIAAALGALVLGYMLGGAGLGGAAAAPNPNGEYILQAIEPLNQVSETHTDLGEPGLSQGDISTFHFEVYDTSGHDRLGYETAHCVIGSVIGGIVLLACSKSFVLADGQIESQGTLEFPAVLGPSGMVVGGPQELTERFAIMGGTGRYEDVGGELHWGRGLFGVHLSFSMTGWTG